MVKPTAVDINSRRIRVFLSSTFRDFMEERDLLVKQVFPRLRKQAQDRGVEVVDVDLRWGVTQQESEQGKVIGICLAEIDNCRPYFIGMLGERYGWIPPEDKYPALVLEQQTWLQQHVGGASVTELEILHGVLNDPKMAGRAFFYFRDPAWSRAQSEPGFVCDTAGEEAKLAALKDRILASGFPVAEDLPDPKAIANQIEADLWALIEEQYPDLDDSDALEREARKHASYCQSRLGVYLGQEYVNQLEALVSGGEQKILITGESGSGKSALIANWMHQHELEHPRDVVYAHHMGCSNDANAIRPLLGRMLDTASKLLIEAELITEPIQVPQDWWELTAKVAETLQDLGRWCRTTGHRWIWVLDGLDRLAVEDQQALPWLPLLIPEGVSVVISALDCPARAIVQERQFQLLEIGPLQRNEQEQLIETYLERYTKKLDADRLQQILACELARSPLFLQVLLEELRQCGRFETLEAQIADYIQPNADGSLAVNDLYARVLARLESDCGAEPVRKALTALWASRAGLSEPELQAITGLAPLQWAPIDLALDKAFSRNGSRLVFDHDYLRKAVEYRYLPTEDHRREAHTNLADWFGSKEEWNSRKAEELPWQLQQAERYQDLRSLLLNIKDLLALLDESDTREVINYWLAIKDQNDGEFDELIADAVEEQIEQRKDDPADQIWLADRIAALLDVAGLHRELSLRLRTLSLELEEAAESRNEESILTSLTLLAFAYRNAGKYDEAERLYLYCVEAIDRVLGPEHPNTLATVNNLGLLYSDKGDYEQAEAYYTRCLEARERLLGTHQTKTHVTINNLGGLFQCKGDYEQAEAYFTRCLEARERLLGPEHPDTLTSVNNLAGLHSRKGDYELAEAFYKRCLEVSERLLPEHPNTLTTFGNLGLLYSKNGDDERAEANLIRCLEGLERLLGPEHPSTLPTVSNLGLLHHNKGDYEQAEAYYTRCLEARERFLGPEHPETLIIISNLGGLFQCKGDYEQAEAFYNRCLEARERLLGPEHPDTNNIRWALANLLSDQERYSESIPLRRQVLEVEAKRDGRDALGTLTFIHRLAEDHYWADELEEAEQLYREALGGRIAAMGDDDDATMASRYGLARCLSAQKRYFEAIELRRVEMAWCRQQNGYTDPGTLASINGLAIDLGESGELEEAVAMFRELLAARQQVLEPSDFGIGRALGRVAETLELAGKLDEAAVFAQQALDHWLEHEGPDAWWTNRERLDLARILHKLGRSEEATQLLDALQASITSNAEPDDDDRQLLADAAALRDQIEANP